MFETIQQRFRDMSTIKTLCLAAEQHGVAVRALKAMGIDPKALADTAAVEISAATVYEV